MKKYIAISYMSDWSKDDDVIKALKGLPDVKLLNEKNLKSVRLIVVENNDELGDDDDIIFRADGGYTLEGKTEASHYDGNEIIEFLKREGY